MKTSNNEYIRRYNDEKSNLMTYIIRRGLNFFDVVKEVGTTHMDKLIGELSEMGTMLNHALMAARMKDIELTAIIGAGAKVQKDTVYSTLFQSDLSDGLSDLMLQLDSKGTTAVLKDYIMNRYEGGFQNCCEHLTGLN